MLNLTREMDVPQHIVIAGCIRIWLQKKPGGRVGVSIEAPKGIPVHRSELADQDGLAERHELAAVEVLAAANRLQHWRDELPAGGAASQAELQQIRRRDHLDQAADMAELLNRGTEAATLEHLLQGRGGELPRPLVRQHLRTVAGLLSAPELSAEHAGLLDATPADVAATLQQLEVELQQPGPGTDG